MADPQARSDVPTFAVIPSGGRPCFEPAMWSVIPQVTHTYVIMTEPFAFTPGDYVDVRGDYRRPKNISRWWNLGIEAAHEHAALLGASAWNVLIMNDDVIACPQLVVVLTQALRHGLIWGEPCEELKGETPVLAYPDNLSTAAPRFALHKEAGFVDVRTRISGWCFMLRGESGLTADEDMQWWYSDNDLDYRARQMGGAVMVPGCEVEHLFPNEGTAASPELSARTHIDRGIFLAKWKDLPH